MLYRDTAVPPLKACSCQKYGTAVCFIKIRLFHYERLAAGSANGVSQADNGMLVVIFQAAVPFGG